MTESTRRIIETIAAIPRGHVATYGQVAAAAGVHGQARQVVRILHTHSRTHTLPWHRVVNRHGMISLPPDRGGALQRSLLEDEGVEFDGSGRIDMSRYNVIDFT